MGAVTRDLFKRLPWKKHHADRRFLQPPVMKDNNHARGSRCFTDEDAVWRFMGHYDLPSAGHSLALGQKLLGLGIIHRIDGGGVVYDLFSHNRRYCVQPLRRTLLLNAFWIFTNNTGLERLCPGPIKLISVNGICRSHKSIIKY